MLEQIFDNGMMKGPSTLNKIGSLSAKEIDSHLRSLAEEIKSYTREQVEVWQAIPYWTMESEGRGGWNDNWNLPYRYGLLGIDDKWPHRLFIELSTGRLVSIVKEALVEASDELIVAVYAADGKNFFAHDHLIARVERATNGMDIFDKERNDTRRAELREKYDVPARWTSPATPIHYTY